MAYALIPDGYSLKKVTKQGERAVNAKRRHDDVLAFLNNPNTPSSFAPLIGAFVGGGLLTFLFTLLKDENVTIPPEVETKVKDQFVGSLPILLPQTIATKGIGALGLPVPPVLGPLDKEGWERYKQDLAEYIESKR